MFLIYAVVYVIYHFMEKKNVPKALGLHCTRREMFGAVLVALGTFSLSNLSFVTQNSMTNSFAVVCIRALFDFVGLIMLYNQQVLWQELQARTEMEAIKTILQRHYQQYQMSSDNMELLKREFHDLKHLILAIKMEKDPEKKAGYLTQMEESIALQEAFIKTENSVLDTVLTTKGIYCAQNGIKFTCLGDGKLLEFIHAIDICSIFGNALDNAIESAKKQNELEKRLINVSLYESNGFIMIEFENYFENELEMKGNIPITTKKDKFLHGYGLKSIRIAAEKYGGTMTINTDNNWFTLRILIPKAQK
jgi:sensor histidine kinase regulating citrate/malate metabolism